MRPYVLLAVVAGALFAAIAAAPGAVDLQSSPAYAAAQNSNDNLLVSAENPEFGNHFAGSMVVEVVVADPLISDTKGGAAGEPKVSVNGATLRMVQSSNGQWYAYFANEDAARRADQISHDTGRPGQGLDFGVFCGPGTPAPVLGAGFHDSDGVAVPRSGGLSNFANGAEPLSPCGGSVDPASPVENNVVRSPPSPSGGEPLHGQIGIKSGAWPVIQLFSFGGDVRIEYEQGGGGPQRVILRYTDDIPSISFSTDRGQADPYPAGAEVILQVSDPQLNQDPTDEDSWTFGVSAGSPSVFYLAFYDGGRTAANGGPGLVNLYPHLGRLGFGDNGYLEVSHGIGDVLELRTNQNQRIGSVYDGVRHYDDIVTLAESRPNSGLFESVDALHASNMRISPGAARGTSAVISYNDRSLSVLTGSHTASLSLGDTAGNDSPSLSVDTSGWRSGLRIPVVLQDADQNTDPNRRDRLDVFRDDAIIPSIRIGLPLTLSPASSAAAYPDSGSFEGAVPIPVRSPDPISARLHLDLGLAALDRSVTYEMLAIDTGYSASRLYDTLIDVSGESSIGTNWLNIDMRSLGGARGLGGASLLLYVGGPSDSDPIIIADRLGAAQSLLQVDPDHVKEIASGLQRGGGDGTVHAVVDFGLGGGLDVGGMGAAGTAPVVLDVFSLGVEGKKIVNNAIYRLELEETSGDSGVFGGTLEFAAANQLNIDDPDFVLDTTPIGSDVKFVTLGRMVDEDAITITYSDLARVGAVIPQSVSQPETEIRPESGRVSVSTPSGQLRFGTPVTITLNDPDLNLSADTIEVYLVVDDPRLPSVDTVGSGAHTLLEVKFKDVRYKRCTVDGVQHGGLASTGFALVETGPETGVFEGVFKMPTRVCDKSGSGLMSTAGGAMDVVYYDSVDSSGNPNTFSMLRQQQQQQQQQSDSLSGARTQSPPTLGNTGSISGSAGPAPDNDNGDIGLGGAGTAGAEIKQHRKPSASLSTNRVALEHVGDVSSIILSGNAGTYMTNSIATITVKHPDGTERSLDMRVGANGKYGAIISLKGGNDLQGNYSVSVEYGRNADPVALLTFYVESTPLVIPDSVRAAASEWSAGMISNAEFAKELSVLVQMNILAYDSAVLGAGDDDAGRAPVVGDNETQGHGAAVPPLAGSSTLPAWMDALVRWWTMGLVPDETFVESVQYLLDAGIVKF